MTDSGQNDRTIILAHNHRLLADMRDTLDRLQPGYGYGVAESDVPKMRQWIADMLWTCEQQLSNSE